MTIQDFTTKFRPMGGMQNLSEQTDTAIRHFLQSITANVITPYDLVKTYNDVFDEIDLQWSKTNRHSLKCGHKSTHILLSSLCNYKLNYYISDELGFAIHPQHFERMRFTIDKATKLCLAEIAMLLAKYDELYTFEVKFAVLRIIATYFNIYTVDAITERNIWCVTAADLQTVINNVLSTELSKLQSTIDHISPNTTVTVPVKIPSSIKHTKALPQCVDDILELFTDDMSQQDKYYILIDAYSGIKSTRKAREIMQQFGLTRKYNKADNKADNKAENKTNDNNMNIVKELMQQVEELQRQTKMQQVTINNLTEQLSKANASANASADVTHSEHQQYTRVDNQFVTAEQAEINNAQVQQASQQKMS